MRFLVDECAGPAVAHWLEKQGHDVFSIYDQARGIDDDRVIEIAQLEERVLITNDRGLERKSFANGACTMASFFFAWQTNDRQQDTRTQSILDSIRRDNRRAFYCSD